MNDECHRQIMLREVMKTWRGVRDICYEVFPLNVRGTIEAKEWIVEGIKTYLKQKLK